MTNDSGRTPDSWRIAAMSVLAGGVLLGDRAAGGGRTRIAVIGICGVVAAAVAPILWAGRRAAPESPRVPLPARSTIPAEAPRFSVIVAARDEATVIGGVVADLAGQDLRDASGGPDLEMVLVDDRSIDGTADVALKAAEVHGIADRLVVLRRDGLELADGKGAALTAAPPERCRGDMIVVLDADARLGPGFLGALARQREAGVRAMTARRRTLDDGTSWLAGAQADEQAVDGAIQAGRWALGGMSEFRGNGTVIERQLLIQAGGWRANALTEDLDLSSRIALTAGVRVTWVADAEVWEQPVRTVIGLWRQRVRWAEGSIRRYLEHGPGVLRSDALPSFARVDFVAYAVQLLSPPIIVGALLGSIRRRQPAVAAALLATYVSASGALTFQALEGERDQDGRALTRRRRIERGGRMAAFSTIWLVAVPGALWRLATRRGRMRYHKMEHLPADDQGLPGRGDGRSATAAAERVAAQDPGTPDRARAERARAERAARGTPASTPV